MAIDSFLVRFAIVYRHVEDAISKGEKSEEDRMLHDAMGKIGHVISTIPMETLESSMQSERRLKPVLAKERPQKAEDRPAGKSKAKAKAKGSKNKKHHAVGANFREKMERLFELLDYSHDGFIQSDEFVKGMSKLPGVLDITLPTGENIGEHLLQCLAKHLDRGGKISIIEFFSAFSYEDNDGVTDALAEHMLTILFWHRHVIRAGCRYFDKAGSGKVDKTEFALVLQAINEEIKESGLHFSSSQVEDLCESISEEENGRALVPYQSFFDAFEVVDSSHAEMSVVMH
jgi:Ca2+-binding EF-hand superfamily protein